LSFFIFLISFFTINLTFGQSSDYQDLVISADLSKNDFISGGTLMQSREFFINGSLTDYIFDAPNSIGRYAIIFESFPNPFDINSNSNKSIYYFNVIYPWFTNWGISFIIVLVSIACLTILIFLSTQTMEKIKLNFLIFKIYLDLTDITTFEIIRFILISIIIYHHFLA
jgi:hypothetical protein